MYTRGLVIIDHGSRRQDANKSLERVAELVAELVPTTVRIQIAHMELASPSIAEAIALCVQDGVRHIVAVPYMLSAGRHATEDIPRLVEEAVSTHDGLSFEVTEPLGVHRLLAELVAQRAGLG